MLPRDCHECGQTIVGRRIQDGPRYTRYCSRACGIKGATRKRAALNRPKPVVCGGCQEPFQPKRRGTKYCCRRCAITATTRKRAARNKPKPTICDGCGEYFQPRRRGTKYCCRGCGIKAATLRRVLRRRKRKPIECPTCLSVFTPRQDGQKFCGKWCSIRRDQNPPGPDLVAKRAASIVGRRNTPYAIRESCALQIADDCQRDESPDLALTG